jgi:hypothetical protein
LDLYDVVRTKRRLSHITVTDGEEVVDAGTRGTIVMVHDERVGYKRKPGEALHFEIEFNNGSNIFPVMTVSEDDLELVTPYKPTPRYEWID